MESPSVLTAVKMTFCFKESREAEGGATSLQAEHAKLVQTVAEEARDPFLVCRAHVQDEETEQNEVVIDEDVSNEVDISLICP